MHMQQPLLVTHPLKTSGLVCRCAQLVNALPQLRRLRSAAVIRALHIQ